MNLDLPKRIAGNCKITKLTCNICSTPDIDSQVVVKVFSPGLVPDRDHDEDGDTPLPPSPPFLFGAREQERRIFPSDFARENIYSGLHVSQTDVRVGLAPRPAPARPPSGWLQPRMQISTKGEE